MEMVAHGLWAAAAGIGANRVAARKFSTPWTVWWAVFPDVFAFGPSFVLGLCLKLSGRLDPAAVHGGHLPHVHVGLPLYPFAHSLLMFLAVFTIASILWRRSLWPMLGWLMHILLDIPTHSFSYYATRFLWPVSEFRIDGIAWWTPWFWVSTYGALALLYFWL